MLAFLGFIVQEFIRLPGDLYSEPNGVKAFFQVGPQPLIQIFLFCGFLEFTLHKGKLTQTDMFADGTREPGACFVFPSVGYMLAVCVHLRGSTQPARYLLALFCNLPPPQPTVRSIDRSIHRKLRLRYVVRTMVRG
jgi:hypothetical protein